MFKVSTVYDPRKIHHIDKICDTIWSSLLFAPCTSKQQDNHHQSQIMQAHVNLQAVHVQTEAVAPMC